MRACWHICLKYRTRCGSTGFLRAFLQPHNIYTCECLCSKERCCFQIVLSRASAFLSVQLGMSRCNIGRTRQRGYLDHAFTLQCTICPQCGCRRASMNLLTTTNAFSSNFVNSGHRNSIRLTNLRAMCRKNISKITFIFQWNLKHSWHTWLSKGNIKGFENNMESEWHDKRDKTGFGSVTRGGVNFSRGHPPELNSVGTGMVWVTGLFSPCLTWQVPWA